MGSNVRKVNAAELAEVVKAGGPVLVDFGAAWCGPCRAMAPVVDKLSTRFAGQVEVVEVDIDESPDAAAAYGIRSVPTFILFSKGESVDRSMGAMPESTLAALVERHVKLVTAAS